MTRYKSFIAHLHSTFEGPGSISGFCHEAAEHNIDMVWLSDHDTRIQWSTEEIDMPRLPLADSQAETEDGFWWQPAIPQPEWERTGVRVRSTGTGLNLRVDSSADAWNGLTLSLQSRRKRHHRPLLAEPVFCLGLKTAVDSGTVDARIILTLALSQTPPEHKPVGLVYCLGDNEGLPGALPLNLVDGQVIIRPQKDAQAAGLGPDHTFRELELRIEARNEAVAEAVLGGLKISTGVSSPDELFRRQARIGSEIGEKYGVEVLAGYEVSGSLMHMNCYGHLLPLIRYGEFSYDPERHQPPSLESVAEHVTGHGGVLSINHPFSKWKRDDLSLRERQRIVREKAAAIIDRQGYGARMIEVGFPDGRHGFDLDCYLDIWDIINRAGLRLAAVGVSDAHSNQQWENGNNLANYVPVQDGTTEELVGFLRKGNFFLADPCRFKGEFSFSGDQAGAMGGVQHKGRARLNITGLPVGSRVIWVVDGRQAEETTVDGACRGSLSLDNMRAFVRVQVLDRDGRLILLSNPIWGEPGVCSSGNQYPA